jgi:hypothetical protein
VRDSCAMLDFEQFRIMPAMVFSDAYFKQSPFIKFMSVEVWGLWLRFLKSSRNKIRSTDNTLAMPPLAKF